MVGLDRATARVFAQRKRAWEDGRQAWKRRHRWWKIAESIFLNLSLSAFAAMSLKIPVESNHCAFESEALIC